MYDADLHVVEPPDLFAEKGIVGKGWADMSLGSQRYPRWYFPLDPAHQRRLLSGDGFENKWDAASTLRAMDKMGIEKAVVYPFRTGILLALQLRPELAFWCCQHYNLWVAKYCDADRSRLFPVGVFHGELDEYQLDAIGEQAVEEGLVGLCRRSACAYESWFPDQPKFDGLYSRLEWAGKPLLFHEGLVGLPYELGNSRALGYVEAHAMLHTFEPMATAARLIYGGVLPRHPGLKVGLIECGSWWVPGWIRTLDDHASSPAGVRVWQWPKSPAHYAKSLYVTQLPERMMWFERTIYGSDYPHGDGASMVEKFGANALDRAYSDKNWRDLYHAN